MEKLKNITDAHIDEFVNNGYQNVLVLFEDENTPVVIGKVSILTGDVVFNENVPDDYRESSYVKCTVDDYKMDYFIEDGEYNLEEHLAEIMIENNYDGVVINAYSKKDASYVRSFSYLDDEDEGWCIKSYKTGEFGPEDEKICHVFEEGLLSDDMEVADQMQNAIISELSDSCILRVHEEDQDFEDYYNPDTDNQDFSVDFFKSLD